MLRSIWEEEKQKFFSGNMVRRLIAINIAVFIIINFINLGFYIAFQFSAPAPGSVYAGSSHYNAYMEVVKFLSLSSDWLFVLTHPWVLITSMFLHQSFFHILWNMLLMYWFGRIVGDFIGNQKIWPIYLQAGLGGAVGYFIFANLIPSFYGVDGIAYGASGAVMGIIVASGVIAPEYIMRLLFLGDVKLKYIVVALVLLDMFAIAGGVNTGGHFAHLGGAFIGYLFIVQLKEGNDWSIWVNKATNAIEGFFSRIFTGEPRRKPKVVYRNTSKIKKKQTASMGARGRRGQAASDRDRNHEDQLNRILDKIKVSGYESLTEEEKEFLFNASKK